MITIPKGKEIIFYENNFKRRILNSSVKLILNEDINLNISSNWESLGDNGSKLSTILGQVTKEYLGVAISGQFKEMGFRLWTSSVPISLSFTANILYKTNAKNDIMLPAAELIKIPLPTIDAKSKNLIPPGPSLISMFDKGATIGRQFSLRIGGLKLNPITIESVEPTFKTEIDDSNGFVNATLKFDVKTLYAASTDMIDSMIRGIDEVY